MFLKCVMFTEWKIGCGSWIKTKICIIIGAEMATNSKRN